VQIPEIRRQVARALSDRQASAYLFGSYARREATPESDVDLLVVLTSGADWFSETAAIRGMLDFGKPVDLVVVDSAAYEVWRRIRGSVEYEASRTGVKLV